MGKCASTNEEPYYVFSKIIYENISLLHLLQESELNLDPENFSQLKCDLIDKFSPEKSTKISPFNKKIKNIPFRIDE